MIAAHSLSPSAAGAHGLIVPSRFKPHPLLPGAHLQTIAPAFIRPRVELAMRVERLETPDDDFVDIGWVGEHNAGGPIATLVHGLGGGFESQYLRGLARRLAALGWRVALLQLRGGGEQPNKLPRSYHHGDTVDLRWLWHRLRALEPQTPIAAVGWSLGGNLLLRALHEEGAKAPVSLAVAASVPFKLRDCAEHMNRGFARVYQHHLLSGLRQIVRRKLAAGPLPDTVDVRQALSARSFFEFDDAFTAPLNGFRNAIDYYERTSCGAIVHDIRVPTLIVQAEDDPFMSPGCIPAASALAPQVTLEVSASGGHVGFVGLGRWGQLDWWLEQRIAAHLQAALGRDEDFVGWVSGEVA
jgi:predicted alpha/beta-fold hydrolase